MVLDDILKFGAVRVVKSRRIVGEHFRRSANAGYRGPDLVRDVGYEVGAEALELAHFLHHLVLKVAFGGEPRKTAFIAPREEEQRGDNQGTRPDGGDKPANRVRLGVGHRLVWNGNAQHVVADAPRSFPAES